jgi:hypothetical protein
MTATTAPAAAVPRPDVPLFSVAGTFLECLAGQDFPGLAATLDHDAHLVALVPSGLEAWHGAERISATFRRWFGDVSDFQLVDAIVGELGPRLHLRWRVRVRAERFGEGWFVVEQQVYADTGSDGRLATLSLLCSGFCPENDAPQLAPSDRSSR